MGIFQNGILLALCGLGLIQMTAALSVADSNVSSKTSVTPISVPNTEQAKIFDLAQSKSVHKRSPGTCRSILARAGDTCHGLSAKCGISLETFKSHNADISCKALSAGKPVCCGAGDHLFPPVRSSATCYTYTIRTGDTCANIASGYKISASNIESWNANTYAWLGCKQLVEGGQMCLSDGEPAMPVAIGDAVCGPQVPGTARPLVWKDIASLNPCPAGKCVSTQLQCRKSG